MSRHTVADEMRKIIVELQLALDRGEALAKSSGMVQQKWFAGARSMVTMAAGEMQQKGLLDGPTEKEPTA